MFKIYFKHVGYGDYIFFLLLISFTLLISVHGVAKVALQL